MSNVVTRTVHKAIATRLVPLLAAIALVLMAGAAPAAAETVPEPEFGQTPGTYAYYTFDQPAVDNVTWRQTIDVSPGQANVFWSNQFTYANGWTGYTGFQTHRDGEGMFLVSIWDSTDSRVGSEGTYCITFSEDGSGRSCRLDVSPIEGHTYVWDVTSTEDGWWKFAVKDETAGTSFVLGEIKVPAGVGMDTKRFVSWAEYFDWNDKQATCMNQPYSKLSLDAPTTRTPTGVQTATWTKDRVSDSCAPMSKVTTTDQGVVEENAIGNSTADYIKTGGDLCLAGGAAARPLTVTTCAPTLRQQWVSSADLTLQADWRCLTPIGSKEPYGVSLAACNATSAQVFHPMPDGTIKNPVTGQCLEARAHEAGAKVWLAECSATNERQQWTVPASS